MKSWSRGLSQVWWSISLSYLSHAWKLMHLSPSLKQTNSAKPWHIWSHRIAEIQMLLRLRHLSIFESDLRLQTRRLSPSSSSYLFWCSYWLPHYQSLSMSISIRIILDSVRFARKTWALSPASPAPAFLDKIITCRVSMAPLRGMWPRHDVKLHMKMEDIEEG